MLGSCLLPQAQRCTRFSLRLVVSCIILGWPRIFGSQPVNRAPDSIDEPVFSRGDQGRELSWNDKAKLRYQIEENHSSARLSSLRQHAPSSLLIAGKDMISNEMSACSARQIQSAINCRPIGHRSLLIEVVPATSANHTAPSTKIGASPLMGNTRSVGGSIYRLFEMIWNQLGLGTKCFSFEAVDHEFEPVCQGEVRPLPAGQDSVVGRHDKLTP
jgi:hypothetical protein